MGPMVSAPPRRLCHHEGVEIAAALIAFMTLVVAWVACPATSAHAVEPVEERAA